MNPFSVQKIITESNKKGERLIIDELNEKCGVRLRHAHLNMSEETFECESCGGIQRHWVKGVSLTGWIMLWIYKPPKGTDFYKVPEDREFASIDDMKTLREINEQK